MGASRDPSHPIRRSRRRITYLETHRRRGRGSKPADRSPAVGRQAATDAETQEDLAHGEELMRPIT
jgi:hypothetical protein